MRSLILACLVIVACSAPAPKEASAPKPAPEEPARRCDGYAIEVDAARKTPPGPGDDSEAQIIDACGCASTIHTTVTRAASLHAAYTAWVGSGCGPVNCDTPCSAMVR